MQYLEQLEQVILTEEEFDFLVKHKKQICENCNHHFFFHVNDAVFGTECVVCKCRNYEKGKCKK